MAAVFRFPEPPPHRGPTSVHRATYFQMLGEDARPLTCATYDTEYGLELRLSRGDDLMRTQLFRGSDRAERAADAAEEWRLALLKDGFTEIDID